MERHHILEVIIILVSSQIFIKVASANQEEDFSISNASEESEGISVAGLHIHKLESQITILIFIMVVVIIKMIYHHLHHILKYIPESCILIILGVLFGGILRSATPHSTKKWDLTSNLFFLYLLPPIILDAAFTITNKSFGANLGVIITFAVMGTVLNFFIIGFVLFGLQQGGVMEFPHLTLKRSLLYSSLIVAVDPVAVLAIFEDLGVNRDLYYMVFGESLLNDAVTIVLYQIMEAFSKTNEITWKQICLGIAKFLTVSFGALLIGILIGIMSSLLTRFTKSCQILEPIIITVAAYLSYILGDLFEWSGIISMIGCGCIQAGYAFHNISFKSISVIRRVVKMLAQISEAVIFLYLGIETVISKFVWHTGFHLWSLGLCLIARGLVVIFLCFLINVSKMHRNKIQFIEQFIISYGGLRGAVAYSLAALIEANNVGGDFVRSVFISSTLFTIFMTVGVMGLTMKPLAKLMHVKLLQQRGLSLMYEMNTTVIGHLSAGIEEITGMKGENHIRDMLLRWDDNYFRKVLLRDPITHDEKLLNTYRKICLALHHATVNPSESTHHISKLSNAYRRNKPVLTETSEKDTLEASEYDDLRELTNVHQDDDDDDSVASKRRLSTKTDADILQMFNHTRRHSISDAICYNPSSGGSRNFKKRLYDMINRRKRHIAQKLHLPRVRSKNLAKIAGFDDQDKSNTTISVNSNYNYYSIFPFGEESCIALNKIKINLDHQDSIGALQSRNDVNSTINDSSHARRNVVFEIPDDFEDEQNTKL